MRGAAAAGHGMRGAGRVRRAGGTTDGGGMGHGTAVPEGEWCAAARVDWVACMGCMHQLRTQMCVWLCKAGAYRDVTWCFAEALLAAQRNLAGCVCAETGKHPPLLLLLAAADGPPSDCAFLTALAALSDCVLLTALSECAFLTALPDCALCLCILDCTFLTAPHVYATTPEAFKRPAAPALPPLEASPQPLASPCTPLPLLLALNPHP